MIFKTFSPVVKMVIERALLAIATARSWPLFQMDVNNTFLQGGLDEDVFMDIIGDFDQLPVQIGSGKKVCKLLKSLYVIN